ncbi:hypothetical protein ACFV2N_07040 [Streptomyces sp. NPDC059680]|uniref:hypothetical protein n=1 Tax=Streptomyces TaxID=1883 RepID=UPI001E64E06D|nr:hypothetical protein [Streptomyces barringtoniae]MCC5477599.1 hypothetical protein [Streptomyces barringtoniae]
MGFDGELWRVRAGEEAVGDIVIDQADFPWLSGTFTAGPGFAAVRDLFARDLALLEQADELGWEEWERAYDEVRRRVSLSSPDGPVAEFLLHIEGDRAWFRWSEEPFAEPGSSTLDQGTRPSTAAR